MVLQIPGAEICWSETAALHLHTRCANPSISSVCSLGGMCFSCVSAQFANKVNNRVVGLVTGAVLTVLGVVMLGIHYREALAGFTFLWNVLECFQWYLVYLAGWLTVLLLARHFFSIPQEPWRKLLHLVAYTSSLLMMFQSRNWATASCCCLVFAAVVYPVLHYAERWKGYAGLFNQRYPGEVKKSLLLLFITHAVLIALCWGWLQKPYIAVAAILMWGVGDTAAALIGKRFGKHHVHLPLADPQKTWEGSIAMLMAAFTAGFCAMLMASPLRWYTCLILAAVAAPVAAYVELISHGGNDTVTVPAAVALFLSLLSLLLK